VTTVAARSINVSRQASASGGGAGNVASRAHARRPSAVSTISGHTPTQPGGGAPSVAGGRSVITIQLPYGGAGTVGYAASVTEGGASGWGAATTRMWATRAADYTRSLLRFLGEPGDHVAVQLLLPYMCFQLSACVAGDPLGVILVAQSGGAGAVPSGAGGGAAAPQGSASPDDGAVRSGAASVAGGPNSGGRARGGGGLGGFAATSAHSAGGLAAMSGGMTIGALRH
jgi:hypothetical protein